MPCGRGGAHGQARGAAPELGHGAHEREAAPDAGQRGGHARQVAAAEHGLHAAEQRAQLRRLLRAADASGIGPHSTIS